MSAIGLPAHILALFVPRPPTDYIGPSRHRAPLPLRGIADYVSKLDSTDTRRICESTEGIVRNERPAKNDRETIQTEKLIRAIDGYNPLVNNNGDPHRTLFVGRLSYDTTEREIKREFEADFGAVSTVTIVYDSNGRSRGYAFVQFENEKDMRAAYNNANGRKVAGRRILVDIERSRITPGWLPRRLGGGRGPGRLISTKSR